MATKLSLRKRVLFSTSVTCGFFLLLEAFLAAIGLTPVTDTQDPFVGFSSRLPLFEETTVDGTVVMKTARNKLVWFNDQAFPKTKPTGTLRVFCLGGSTTYGRPYHDSLAFSGWLRNLLPVFSPDHAVEIINAGGVSYASYRVATVLEELSQYDPDLFVVYSAQNEFLERRTYRGMFERSHWLQFRSALAETRCWAAADKLVGGRFEKSNSTPAKDQAYLLPAEVDEMLNHTIGPLDYHRDPGWQRQVVQHYEFNLRRMVALARQNGAAVMFVMPASNLRDCSPFKSQNSVDLDTSQIESFDELLYDAHQLIDQNQPQQALSQLKLAEDLDEHFAYLHYEKGRALFALQQYAEAREAFQRAIDEDVCPLRAVTPLANALRRVAADTNSHFIDYERQIRDRCLRDYGHDCLGKEHFLDHVHPTIDEHRELAMAILTKLDEIGFIRQSEAFTAAAIQPVARQVLAKIDNREQGVAFRNLAKVFHWAGKFSEALPLAERALTHLPTDVPSMFVAGECERLLGRPEKALPFFEQLILLDPFHMDGHIALGMMLADRDELEDAALHLSIGVGGLPNSWYAQQEYGIVLFRLAEYADASNHLDKADQLQPANTRTLYYLAHAQVRTNHDDRATKLFTQLLEIDEQDADAHHELGMLLMRQNRNAEAVEHFAAALRIDPTLEEARDILQRLQE